MQIPDRFAYSDAVVIYLQYCMCFYIHTYFTLLYARSKLYHEKNRLMDFDILKKNCEWPVNFLCIEDQWRMQWPRHSPVLWTGIPYTDKKVWGYFFLIRAEGITYKLIFAEMREHFDLCIWASCSSILVYDFANCIQTRFKFPILFHSVHLARSWLMDIFLQSLWWQWTKVASSSSSTKNIYSSFI